MLLLSFWPEEKKVFKVGRDIVGWFMRNLVMQSLEYNWQNWQYIKKTTNINSRFHRDGKPTDLTSPTWGRQRGRMRSQSRPNLNRSPRLRRPENVCILSSLLYNSVCCFSYALIPLLLLLLGSDETHSSIASQLLRAWIICTSDITQLGNICFSWVESLCWTCNNKCRTTTCYPQGVWLKNNAR